MKTTAYSSLCINMGMIYLHSYAFMVLLHKLNLIVISLRGYRLISIFVVHLTAVGFILISPLDIDQFLKNVMTSIMS